MCYICYIYFNPIRELQYNIEERIDPFISQPENSTNAVNINMSSSNNSTPKKVCKLTFKHYPEHKPKQSVFKTKQKKYVY